MVSQANTVLMNEMYLGAFNTTLMKTMDQAILLSCMTIPLEVPVTFACYKSLLFWNKR